MRTLLIALALAVALSACQQAQAPTAEKKAEPAKELKTDVEKYSYAIGMDIGSRLKEQTLEFNPELIAQGLSDGYKGKAILSDDEAKQTLVALQQKMMEQQMAETKKKSEENLAAGQKFLEENKAKEGVKTTESGLQYKVVTEGTGPKPSVDDTVTVDYRGTLIDGTEFDSSYKRGQPVTFPLAGVIPGWTEALQLMPVGSKWELYIPASLAYGDRQVGNVIGPNSTLIFEVELKGIEPKTAASPEAAVKPEAKPEAKKPEAKPAEKPAEKKSE